MPIVKLITAALNAYISHMSWKERTYIYDLEDRIDELARLGTPTAKLRLERLNKRYKFERKRALRSPDSNSD